MRVGIKRMTRRLIALALLLLMTVVVATSQPGLRYCLCFGTASFGSCECVSESQSNDDGATCGSASCPCPAETEEAFLQSCENCSVEIFINLDEFADVTVRDATEKSVPLHVPSVSGVCDSNILSPIRRAGFHEARGSPPSVVELTSVPLRVRYSVFLV